MSEIKLYNGDCLEIMKQMPDESVDLIVTSPPYDNLRKYNNSSSWNFEIFKPIANECKRIVKSGGIIVWVVGDQTIKGSETGTSFKQALYFKNIGLNIHDTMIYAKKAPKPLTHNRYEQQFEYMFIFSKDKPKTFNPLLDECVNYGKKSKMTHRRLDDSLTKSNGYGKEIKKYKYKNNIWFYHNINKTEHPAPFPLTLAEDHILSWSNECDIVLDPFMGSGTTGVACINTNRNFIGIEIDPTYFNIAKERIEKDINNGNNNIR